MKKSLLICSLVLGSLFNAQLTSLNETFQDFPFDGQDDYGGYGSLPYAGWTSNEWYPYVFITKHSATQGENAGNKYLKTYSLDNPTKVVFVVTPELVSTGGQLKFRSGSSGGSLQVGTMSNPTDWSTFTSVSEYTLGDSLAPYTINLPESTDKYIAFRFQANGQHRVCGLDNVMFTPTIMATNEVDTKTKDTFAVDEVSQRLIFTNNPVSIKVYNTLGSLVLDEKVEKNYVDISKLGSGVYLISIEDKDNEITNSKFIKK